MLVEIEVALDYLRAPNDDDDGITRMIGAASALVLFYIGRAEDSFLDSTGAMIVPEPIQAAVLYLVAERYANREGGVGKYTAGHLPDEVRAMLSPYRDPVVC
jgi:hypothetical protein